MICNLEYGTVVLWKSSSRASIDIVVCLVANTRHHEEYRKGNDMVMFLQENVKKSREIQQRS